MCVATAIIVGASVGGQLVAAKIGSNASKNAAKTQSDAAAEGLKSQQARYAQDRADFQPYAQAGAAAVGRMATQATAPSPTFRPGQPQQLGTMQSAPPQGAPMTAAPSPMAGAIGAAAGQAPQAQPQAAMWTVQAPDGSTKQLAPPIAQQFMARGAKRIA